MCLYEATAARAGNQENNEVSRTYPERWNLYNQSCCQNVSAGILDLSAFVEGLLLGGRQFREDA